MFADSDFGSFELAYIFGFWFLRIGLHFIRSSNSILTEQGVNPFQLNFIRPFCSISVQFGLVLGSVRVAIPVPFNFFGNADRNRNFTLFFFDSFGLVPWQTSSSLRVVLLGHSSCHSFHLVRF